MLKDGQLSGFVRLPRALGRAILDECADVEEIAIVFALLLAAQHSPGRHPLRIPGEPELRPLAKGELVTSYPELAALLSLSVRTVQRRIRALRDRFDWLTLRPVSGFSAARGGTGGLYCRVFLEAVPASTDRSHSPVSSAPRPVTQSGHSSPRPVTQSSLFGPRPVTQSGLSAEDRSDSPVSSTERPDSQSGETGQAGLYQKNGAGEDDRRHENNAGSAHERLRRRGA